MSTFLIPVTGNDFIDLEHPLTGSDRPSVTFSSNHENARVPNPRLLALHAGCARVVHMSGDTEDFDELERNVEETRVLAFDI